MQCPRCQAAADVAKCPRCRGRLRLTHDRQRNTSFTYLRCPNGHGRLTTFFDFLREKDFVKPLAALDTGSAARGRTAEPTKGGRREAGLAALARLLRNS